MHKKIMHICQYSKTGEFNVIFFPRQRLWIAIHHLESFPKMKYNNQIILKRYLSVSEIKKNKKNYNNSMDRRGAAGAL